MKIFALTLLCLGLSTTALATDLTVTYQLKEGKKVKGEKTVYWSDQFHLMTDSANKRDVLTDNTKGIIYTIDHKNKQIEVLNAKQMAGMTGDVSQMMGDMMAKPGPKGKTMGESMEEGMKKYMGDPEKAVLQKLGTLTIAGRSCDHYLVERKGKRMEMSQEVCIDPTLNPPQGSNPELQQMAENAQGLTSGSGPMANFISPGQRDLAALKGIPLKSVDKTKTKMFLLGGTKKWDEEAISVKEGPIEASVFQLPAAYKQIDQGQMMQEEMEKARKMMGGG